MLICPLSEDLTESSKLLPNKYIVKLILEHTQVLYTVQYLTSNDKDLFYKNAPLTKTGKYGYKPSHINHVLTRTICQNQDAYDWLIQYTIEMCKEYTIRYHKIHSCEKHINYLSNITLDNHIPIHFYKNEYYWIQIQTFLFPLLKPDYYYDKEKDILNEDLIQDVYRYYKYYINKKIDNGLNLGNKFDI
jgi:hypothetical protein